MDNISNIMAAIVAILKNNGLTELSLENYEELNDPTYIIWFDDDGTPYDDPVIKVIVEDSEVSVEVEARNFTNNVTIQAYEINRLEWWQASMPPYWKCSKMTASAAVRPAGNRFVPDKNTARRPAADSQCPSRLRRKSLSWQTNAFSNSSSESPGATGNSTIINRRILH